MIRRITIFLALALSVSFRISKATGDIPEGDIMLLQNYPDPFTLVTMIEFRMPCKSHVRIFVIDGKGRKVSKIVDGNITAGKHHVFFKPSDSLSSGSYKCRMEVLCKYGEVVWSDEIDMKYMETGNAGLRR